MQIDITGDVIALLKKLGLAKNVKRVSEKQLASKSA